MFKVMVSGTSTFNNYELLKEKLDFYLQAKSPVMLISGREAGADQLAVRYAQENKCSIMVLSAQREQYGAASCFQTKRAYGTKSRGMYCLLGWKEPRNLEYDRMC